jgi:glycine/D-amino acid oxidase-like deaminating enzyme
MMGCSLALLLARKKIRVTLFEGANEPMSKTARWNEGKIHLGYLYAADRSLDTARELIPGGVAFRPIVEDLIDGSIESHMTRDDDIYLTHTRSVIDAGSMLQYFNSVSDLVAVESGAGIQPIQLSGAELSKITANPDVVAGFRIPERSVNTNWLADRLAERVKSERLIDLRCNYLVTSLSKDTGRWDVITHRGNCDGFDVVINALWEGRSVIDSAVGRSFEQSLSYRYRVALFMQVPETNIENVVIATGPFGDIKNYDGRHLYLSWYPAGLLLDCHQQNAPATPTINDDQKQQILNAMIAGLGEYFPVVLDFPKRAQQLFIAGGWVVARGKGLLSDPASTLHRRDEIGIRRDDTYYSIETGKYSVAPWLASRLADELAG